MRYRRKKNSEENELQNEIIDWAKKLRYRWFHDYDPVRNEPGFPDLHIVGRGRQLVLECKSNKGDATDDQLAWLREYERVREIKVGIVRPRDRALILDYLNRPEKS